MARWSIPTGFDRAVKDHSIRRHDWGVAFKKDPRSSPPFRRLTASTQAFSLKALSDPMLKFLGTLKPIDSFEILGNRWCLPEALSDWLPPFPRRSFFRRATPDGIRATAMASPNLSSKRCLYDLPLLPFPNSALTTTSLICK